MSFLLNMDWFGSLFNQQNARKNVFLHFWPQVIGSFTDSNWVCWNVYSRRSHSLCKNLNYLVRLLSYLKKFIDRKRTSPSFSNLCSPAQAPDLWMKTPFLLEYQYQKMSAFQWHHCGLSFPLALFSDLWHIGFIWRLILHQGYKTVANNFQGIVDICFLIGCKAPLKPFLGLGGISPSLDSCFTNAEFRNSVSQPFL